MNQTLLCSQRSRHENAYQGPARETQTSLLQHTSLALESQILSSKTKAPFLFGAVLVTTLLTGQAQAQTHRPNSSHSATLSKVSGVQMPARFLPARPQLPK